jgi:hypothetical protein
MAAQDAALEEPDFFKAESEELHCWYGEEVKRRSDEPAVPAPARRRRAKELPASNGPEPGNGAAGATPIPKKQTLGGSGWVWSGESDVARFVR